MSAIMNASPYENVATKGSRTMAHRARLIALASATLPGVDTALKAVYRDGIQIFPAGNSTTETEFRRQFEARADVLDLSLRTYENALNTEIGSGSGMAGGQLVFSPNNPSPGAGVFTNWADLYAAFQATRGMVDIVFDYANGFFGMVPALPAEYSVFPIPADAYDFERRARFRAPVSSALCIILPAAGTTIVGLSSLSGGVGVYNETPDPIILLGEIAPFWPEILFLEFGASVASGPGAAPVVTLGNGPSQQSVIALLAGNILDAGAPSVGVAPNGFGILFYLEHTEISQNSLAGDATTTLFAIIGAASANANLVSQANFLGALFMQLGQFADQLGYIPGNAGNWGSSVPDDVAEALDTIAANVVIP